MNAYKYFIRAFKLETTQMSIGGRMDKQNVVQSSFGILEGLVLGPTRIPKSGDAHIFHM